MSNEIVLFNPLSLSDEEFDAIASLSALNYTYEQMAIYLEIDFEQFEKAIKSKNSKVQHHITRGKLESKFLVNEKLLQNAQSGNITASQELRKVIEANDVEEIKKKILYGE